MSDENKEKTIGERQVEYTGKVQVGFDQLFNLIRLFRELSDASPEDDDLRGLVDELNTLSCRLINNVTCMKMANGMAEKWIAPLCDDAPAPPLASTTGEGSAR